MARQLKVYRTAVGFRDAYVAATSQAAALRAWGTDKNLFTRGVAEVVTDPELASEPLKQPGVIIYRSRGDLRQQVAALGSKPKRSKSRPPPSDGPAPAEATRRARRNARPSRDKLDKAQALLADIEKEFATAEQDLARKEAALARERDRLERKFHQDREKRAHALTVARREYDEAMRDWEP